MNEKSKEKSDEKKQILTMAHALLSDARRLQRSIKEDVSELSQVMDELKDAVMADCKD